MSLLRCDAGTGRNMQPMRGLAALAGFILAVGAAAPAVAGRTGAIEGRVINGTTNEPQSGVEVILTKGAGDRRSEETAVTGRDGTYRFRGLPTGGDRFYVVDALYKQGLFAGRPLRLPDDTDEPPVIDTTLRVFEPTTDPNAILIRRNDLFVVHRGDRLSVVEAVNVVNPTRNAYIGRGSALGGGDGGDVTASLGFALPDGVIPESFRWLQADLDVPRAVEIEGVGFGITTAVPPGEVDFTFSYQVSGDGGIFDLSRRALYEVSELSVFAAAPLTVTSNRLGPRGSVTLEETTYERFSTTDAANAADPVQILVVAEGGTALPLVAGLAGGLGALLLVGVIAFRRTRRRRGRANAADADPVPAGGSADRDRLLSAIAELDLRHSSGEVEDGEYSKRRADLKERLSRATGTGTGD